ncbi:site-2 protease family protein [Hazenella coriacea]|uniref:Stage IV sporulation protein FB n=1 Tax=Hazenella coriacea TaxID=1179467 RepID=A0A4R3LDU9_9BACL|nr:site-2 protease family protein [Hazenella coriacea]TCS96494.1 stage IV sporulation protein FB [Hazenella coriacea]
MNRRMWKEVKFQIHPLFWLLVCSAIWTGYFLEVLTLMVLVVIHELGHMSAAWSYGWRIHSMQLLPFGGVAKMEEWGTVSAQEEMIVALAGPFQHMWMIIISYLFYFTGFWSKGWTDYFILCNFLIAGFNLLPIYPLDGGRVIQALLSYLMPYRLCIMITLWLGIICSTLLVIGSFILALDGVLLHLLFLSLFLVYSNVIALKQKNIQYIRFLLRRRERGISHSAKIQTLCVNERDPLWSVVKRWYKEHYHVLKVVDQKGRVIGFIPEEQILEQYFDSARPNCKIKELIS